MNRTYKIKNSTCPICSRRLSAKTVKCSNGISLPCLECEKCKNYFFHNQYYKLVKKLEGDSGGRLKKNVYFYIVETNVAPQKSKTKNTPKGSNKSKTKSKTLAPTVASNKNSNIKHIQIDKRQVDTCSYYKKGHCLFFDGRCNPCSVKCKYPERSLPYTEKLDTQRNRFSSDANLESPKTNNMFRNVNKHIDGITAIVITFNKKCLYQNHYIEDVVAHVKIVKPSGEIIVRPIEAGYCEECDEYYILKKDFLRTKEEGILLCPILDMTSGGNSSRIKHSAQLGNESEIHIYGYNVKKNNGYTDRQRQVVLANILENTNISKHAIRSSIIRYIKQHQGQSNYAEAVTLWSKDLKFVENYQLGDIPEVSVNKVIVKQ